MYNKLSYKCRNTFSIARSLNLYACQHIVRHMWNNLIRGPLSDLER